MLMLNKKEAKIRQSILKELILILLGTFFLAEILAISLWQNYLILCHISIELVCIFISFIIFLLAWYTYESNAKIDYLICFVFLMVGIFDMLYLYFYCQATLNFQSNLSVWYWLLGIFTLAAISVFITADLKIKLNKYLGLFLSLGVVGFIAAAFYNYAEFLPVLFSNDEGYTKIKIFIDCIIIALFLLSLYNLRDKITRNEVLTYRYLISALLVAIPMTICFMVNSSTFFYDIMGHLLQITCYVFFLQGIFVGVVRYPYHEIEEKNKAVIQVFDEIPLGIVIYDQYFRLFLANKKALNLLTCRSKDIYGLHHDEIIQKLGFVNTLEQRGYNRGVIKNVYIDLRSKLGVKYKIKADYYKLSNSYLVLFEELKAEQELETLKIQMRTILNSINKAILLLDVENQIIMCNKNCLEVLEMEENEVVGKNAEELRTLLQFKADGSINNIEKNKKTTELHEVSIVTPHSNKKSIFFHIDYLRNMEEEIIGMVILATDITLFKKESLKMQQKEKLIALGQMAAGIVHEIKNPLTTIKGFSQLIKYKVEDEKIREYAGAIEQETEIMNNFVNDFLMFAKPSSPVLEQIRLNEIIESMKVIINANTIISGVNVSFALISGDKPIMADVNQLRQVLLNIVKNAVEAVADKKNAEIKLFTKYHQQTEEMSVTIFNNGKAMTAEEKMMVGTPFFTTKENGTGLGLSICFQIIKEHNGRIEIESEEGVGTSFIVYLPCITS
ncbi:MAG: MASE3 domain-containing protein [Clostridia bacterium]|nr:MASE3 domain-containing protein [Clostridia bacterium]MDD4145948.1 MASE3 domain-containing protein [Clostridia bacterium]MDD4665954.1 MASE3 domain-containing protein [Clostridia bacterium]